MTEFRKGAVRIVSNFVRLAATMLLGLILIRILLDVLGAEATGSIDLLGSTIGLAAIVEEVVGSSMIRELGVAHHSGDEETFRRVYNSALVVSAVGAVVTLGLHGVILGALPLMDVPQNFLDAAKWFVIAKGVESAAIVFLAPLFNMYLVTERQVHYNFWLVARRASLVLSAMTLAWMNTLEPLSRLIWFGWISCFLHISIIFVSVLILVTMDRRMIPIPRLATRQEIRAILGISGWNIAIFGSQWMGLSASQIIMNLHFGLFGNLILGRAAQLGGYARMLTTGLSHGLDSVSVRLSSQGNGGKEIRSILYHSTRLHGLVAFPAVFGMAGLAEPILGLWMKGRLDRPHLLPDMVTLTRILLIGFLAMAISDNWTKMMYGAGHIRRYTPIVIMGGLVNLALALLLVRYFPDSIRYTAPPWAFSLMYLTCYLGLMSRLVTATLEVKLRDLFSPLVQPLVAAIVCVPVLVLFLFNVAQWTLPWLITAVASYVLSYAVLCWYIVLGSEERINLSRVIGQWRGLQGGSLK